MDEERIKYENYKEYRQLKIGIIVISVISGLIIIGLLIALLVTLIPQKADTSTTK